MVKAAKKAYAEYPTVVNDIPESGVSYDNTLEEYARMDIKMQSSQKAIGGASNTAQLSMSYYFNALYTGYNKEYIKDYYDICNILAVLA